VGRLVAFELHAAQRRAIGRHGGQRPRLDVGEDAQPLDVPLGGLDLVVAQREEFLDLVQLVRVGGGELPVLLRPVHRLVEEGAPDHRAVVARLSDVELLTGFLQLLHLVRVQAAVRQGFLHLVAVLLLLLVALEELLHLVAAQPILDSHFVFP